MKKLIHQTLALAVLSTSLASFGTPAAFAKDLNTLSIVKESKQADIKNIMSELSSNIERGMGERKSLAEATMKLQDNGISAQDMVDFAASGMEAGEAAAFRAKMKSKLNLIASGSVSNDELGDMVAEIANGSQGVNYRSNCGALMTTAWVTGIAAATFAIMAMDANGRKTRSEDDIKQLKLDKVALQGEIDILLNEGLPSSSFYIANLRADVAYIDEQMSQKSEEFDKASKNLQTYLIVAGATGSVSLVTSVVTSGRCW